MPTRTDRILAAIGAAGLLLILVIAARLTPSTTGFGTHEQIRLRSGIGLQMCSWVALTGSPCATCGMTTSFAHAADGDLISAFRAQPFGAILAVLTAAGFWILLSVSLSGSAIGSAVVGSLGRKTFWATLALLVGAWGYKIATWPAP